MTINFSEAKCQYATEKKLFGLCDDSPPPPEAAYIDEKDGAKWIAVVVNDDEIRVTFTAIDNCIDIKRNNGKMAKRCDGALTFNSTIAFVELKVSDEKRNQWIRDAEGQLRSTIISFENSEEAEGFKLKKAYIANSAKPKFRESQKTRMDKFLTDTGYVLRIENRIII